MKFIRVYDENMKNDEYGYFLINVNNIQHVYLEENREIKGKKRVSVYYIYSPSGYENSWNAHEYRSYYLGKNKDKASDYCWLDSNLAEELYEELETILNKE